MRQNSVSFYAHTKSKSSDSMFQVWLQCTNLGNSECFSLDFSLPFSLFLRAWQVLLGCPFLFLLLCGGHGLRGSAEFHVEYTFRDGIGILTCIY